MLWIYHLFKKKNKKNTEKVNNHHRIIDIYLPHYSTFQIFDSHLFYYHYKINFKLDMYNLKQLNYTSKRIYQNDKRSIIKIQLKNKYVLKTIYNLDIIYVKNIFKICNDLKQFDPLQINFVYPILIQSTSRNISLYSFFNGYDLYQCIHSQQIQKKNILHFLSLFESLIIGLSMLNEKEWVHNDIKLENILFHPNHNSFKIIDLEESLNTIDNYIQLEKENKINIGCDKQDLYYYYIWPIDRWFKYHSNEMMLDYHLIPEFYIKSLDFSHYDILLILFSIKYRQKIYSTTPFTSENILYIEYSHSSTRSYTQYKEYFQKLDIYSLGIVFSELFCVFQYTNQKLHQHIFHLRNKMIEPNYKKRFSIQQIHSYYKSNISPFLSTSL
jgi:serine/threonine protein kinase